MANYTAVVERLYNKNKSVRHEYVLKIFDNKKFSNRESLNNEVNKAVDYYKKEHKLHSFHLDTVIVSVDWDYNESYF